MALTPQKIQDLADPIEQIYIDATEDLLANIGRHLRAPSWTHTAVWEVNKLAEMGQLTAENARILNNHIKSIPKAIRDTMEETRAAALDRLEKQLEDAVKSGALPEPMKDSTADVLKEYSQQAADHLNLVNTTMLQSSLNQYARAVQLTAEEERRAAATQAILNQAAGDVNLGVETRETALRKAIGQIADEGLTGFYDRAGRKWTPEAYVNMDIRTTVHNTAIQSVKNRMQDFNTSVFQVSSHAAARPLCYPYQGRFYSWDNTAGQIELGDGRTVNYEPLNTTSYGMPAGLFGINCGHYPIPIVPGVTIPHGADNIQPEKENDAAYAESQKQRALERDIRAKKRVLEMAGDLATDEQKDALKRSQDKMRQFIAETGRTRRYDRERIGGTQGAKLANTQRQAAPTTHPAPTQPTAPATAKTAQEALVTSGVAKKAFLPSSMPDATAQELLNTLERLHAQGYPTINGVAYDAKKCAQRGAAAFYDHNTDVIYIGRRFMQTPEEFAETFARAAEKYAEKAAAKEWHRWGTEAIRDGEKALADAKNGYEKTNAYERLKSGYMLTGNAKQNTVCRSMGDVLTHEYGHFLHLTSGVKVPGTTNTEWNVRADEKHFEPYRAASEMGAYALSSPLEAVAESFVLRQRGDTVPVLYADVLNDIDRELKK